MSEYWMVEGFLVILNNIFRITEQIQCAQKAHPGKANPVKIIAVTKNHPVERMRTAIDAGITAIGENRIQEAIEKKSSLNRQVEWHLVGHLQTNKVKQAVATFDLIHSVDSAKLAVAINQAALGLGKVQDVLIQANIANEDTKYGVAQHEILPLAQIISGLPGLRLCGLMTIAPYFPEPEHTRPIFHEAYKIFTEMQQANLPNSMITWLSMGMTNDYAVAVEEGANLVRIGTGIFGERQL